MRVAEGVARVRGRRQVAREPRRRVDGVEPPVPDELAVVRGQVLLPRRLLRGARLGAEDVDLARVKGVVAALPSL